MFAFGAWVAVGGLARAGLGGDPPSTHAFQMAVALETGNTQATVAAARTTEDDPPVTPQPPCPIEVPGGVICRGPVFPEFPPGNGLRRTVYLPVMYW